MKICSKCKTEKPLSDFTPQITGKLGHKSYCKECHNKANREYYLENKLAMNGKNIEHHYRIKYNLSVEEVEAAKEKQDNRCLICNIQGKLHCDHCHATGKVRGFLCSSCNKALGLFKDNEESIERALMYLRFNK